MVMGYLYFEIVTEQISKRIEKPSGDVCGTERDKISTIHILCDGVGSGIQANVAATMTVARMKELLHSGFTLRQAFANIVHSMEDARKKDLPCTFFSVARVLPDGVTSILTYEMPDVLFVSKRYSTPLKCITQTFFDGIVGETGCSLNKGEGIILMSDGITQAGLGKGYTHGWRIEGVNKFVNDLLASGANIKDLPKQIIREAKKVWKDKCEDDCSVSLIYCRRGKVINLLTGPPLNPDDDEAVVKKFLNTEGIKIVCGATTAKIVARVLNTELEIDASFNSLIAPPNYEIKGIDLVTEGAVTLNQLYNIWGEDMARLEKNSPVTELFALMNIADRVNLFIGETINPAVEEISFKQSGILTREKIVPLLIENLKKDGKIVSIEKY